MNISRFNKSIVAITIMLLVGVYYWLLDGWDEMITLQELIPLAIIIVGTAASLLAMRTSLRDVLSMMCIFIGLYLIAKFITQINSEFDGLFLLSLSCIVAGIFISLLGLSLWSGYDFNIVRIRIGAFVILGLGAFYLLYNFHRRTSILDFFIDNQGMILILLLGISIALIAIDRSLGYSSITTRMKQTVKSAENHMMSLKDAYILRSNVDTIKNLENKEGSGEAHILLMSHDLDERQLVFKKDRSTGTLRMEINAPSHSYINPVITLEVDSIVFDEDHFTVYGKGGKWSRILIHDRIPENFDNPKLFGREINLNRIIRKRKLYMLAKKNSKE